jgi:hypothetical protein
MVKKLIRVVSLAFDLCGSYNFPSPEKANVFGLKTKLTSVFGIWKGKLSSEDAVQYIVFCVKRLRNV